MVIIESREADIQRETRELYAEIKPYLDDGKSFTYALKKLGKSTNNKSGWYKRLREYTVSQGYVMRQRRGFKE